MRLKPLLLTIKAIMSQKGFVTLVNGYHPDTPVPKLARKENLDFRFAVVLETAHPDYESTFFQAELFVKLISAIQKQIESNRLEIEVDESMRYSSIHAFEAFLFESDALERMPPHRIFFRKEDELIGLEETEFWTLCGGPAPYSDSYTAAFYTRNDLYEAFHDVCSVICSDMGITIREEIQGSLRPEKTGWRKLFFPA